MDELAVLIFFSTFQSEGCEQNVVVFPSFIDEPTGVFLGSASDFFS